MSVLNRILDELDEHYIVKYVTQKIGDANIQYHLRKNTVSSDTEFDDVIADYYHFMFGRCISRGASLPRAEAAGRAKEIIFGEYQRKRMNKLDAYRNGKDGTNGGMRAILDIIYHHIDDQATEYHIRDVIDRYVRPSAFHEQVALVREMLTSSPMRSSSIDEAHPERYARDYEELVRILMQGRKSFGSVFRRI